MPLVRPCAVHRDVGLFTTSLRCPISPRRILKTISPSLLRNTYIRIICIYMYVNAVRNLNNLYLSRRLSARMYVSCHQKRRLAVMGPYSILYYIIVYVTRQSHTLTEHCTPRYLYYCYHTICFSFCMKQTR